MTDQPTFELRTAAAATDTVVVTVLGEIDMTTAPELADALAAATPSVRRVVVDLSNVTFLDSSGLSALVRSRRELAGAGVDLGIVAPPSSLARRVIGIAQLDSTLAVVGSLDDARS